jgi:Fic family protein
MKKFIKDSNELINDNILNEDANMFEIAAKISYNFVRIHPFRDFNGRLSRIIMNMILIIFGSPFFIPLKGDKKGKKRYLTSLKQANNGKIKPLASLIAKNTVEIFDEFDKNIQNAGLKSLLKL